MNATQERILVVENDPTISDLIARQTLIPLGYKVQVVGSASSAVQDAVRYAPDLIITNLGLPGLSGKDLLVAFSSQGLDIPIVVLADQDKEGDIIDAFRLGASDYLTSPVREAEVVSVVERVLKQVRSRREKDQLARQLNQTNAELQRKVRELTTIFAMGKAVISITDLHSLFDKIVEGAVFVSEADSGWLLFRDEHSKGFLLSAGRNLPGGVTAYMHQAWDDGLSSLVALSGESLSIHGDPLKRFKIASLGKSALVVPVKVKNNVVGLLVVVRKAAQPFSKSSQALLEAVADYASISIVNARLFRALNERIDTSQQKVNSALLSNKIGSELFEAAGADFQDSLSQLKRELNQLYASLDPHFAGEQSGKIHQIEDALENALYLARLLSQLLISDGSDRNSNPDLNELTKHTLQRFQPAIQRCGISLITQLSPFPIKVAGNADHISKAVDGMLAYIIQNSARGSQITVRVSRTSDKLAQLKIQNPGLALPKNNINKIFAPKGEHSSRAGQGGWMGLGISLSLVREIFSTYNGKIWAEVNPEAVATFIALLPLVTP